MYVAAITAEVLALITLFVLHKVEDKIFPDDWVKKEKDNSK